MSEGVAHVVSLAEALHSILTELETQRNITDDILLKLDKSDRERKKLKRRVRRLEKHKK